MEKRHISAILFLAVAAAPSSFAARAMNNTYLVGSSFSFDCHAIWVKPSWNWTDADGANEQILSHNGLEPFSNLTESRYGFVRTAFCHYKISVSDARFSDAGTFTCYAGARISSIDVLSIMSRPKCEGASTSAPALVVEEGETKRLRCSANITDLTKDGSGQIVWKKNNKTLESRTQMHETYMESVYEYVAKPDDLGAEITCEVSQKYLSPDVSRSDISCSFGEVNVRFEPKITCPKEELMFIGGTDKHFVVQCQVSGNPLSELVNDIRWILEDQKPVKANTREVDGQLLVEIDLSKGILSSTKTKIQITLEVPNNVGRRGSTVTDIVRANYVHGPEFGCPPRAKPNLNKDGTVMVECTIYVNPPIPAGNISWYVNGELLKRQQVHLMEDIVGGHTVSVKLDPMMYDVKTVDVELRAKGIAPSIATKEIEVTFPGKDSIQDRLNDKITTGRKPGGRKDASLLAEPFGIVLLAAFIGTLFLLTVIVCVAVVKFTRRRRDPIVRLPPLYQDDVEIGTMHKPSGSEPPGDFTTTTLFKGSSFAQSGTMTTKMIKNMKTANKTEDWAIGFAKLTNALYLKDTDQDGYLTVMEARPVLLNYSQIYDLGFTDEKMDAGFSQCSNGEFVDVETLLHIMSKG